MKLGALAAVLRRIAQHIIANDEDPELRRAVPAEGLLISYTDMRPGCTIHLVETGLLVSAIVIEKPEAPSFEVTPARAKVIEELAQQARPIPVDPSGAL